MIRRRTDPVAALPDALRAVRDGLRAGLSLRQALLRAARSDGSPLHPLITALDSERELAAVLTDAAANAPEDLALCLLCLSVQARTGGDPSSAVDALEARVRSRLAAAREVRAMSAQARMSARAMLLLTPAFLGLFAALDPSGTAASLRIPATRLAIAGGLALQGLGGWWMSRIVNAPLKTARPAGRLSRLPVLRALTAMAGRGDDASRAAAVRDQVAAAAEVAALGLTAGLPASGALALAADAAGGTLGDGLRAAVREIDAGTPRADALRALAGTVPESGRFVGVIMSGDELGVPVADALRAIAAELRAERATEIAENVRRASIKILAPLGLLVLPAFVLACLVPLFLNGLQELSL